MKKVFIISWFDLSIHTDTKTSVTTSKSQESYSDIPKKLNSTMNESLLTVEFHNIFNYIESIGLLGQEYWIRPVNESNLIQGMYIICTKKKKKPAVFLIKTAENIVRPVHQL